MLRLVLTFTLLVFATGALAGNGLVKQQSNYAVAETADRLVSVLEDKGMTVMARVDHAANARKAEMDLRPTQLVIFGNPKVGTPLMQCSQSIAIDLPQKALIWEDAEGDVWLAYNEPEYLEFRHAVVGCDEVLAKVEKALAAFARAATQ
ncbi:DUF302 domain-containing protein [Ectothiorhodospiraceae bacterium WFHF3C12]|nr:DUF302 domain-containing protein [Ectothiorhodospiraceae bacterium WFHF3C12]